MDELSDGRMDQLCYRLMAELQHAVVAGFADRGSRDAKLRGEIRFGRERLSNFYLAADDLAFDQIRYLAIGGFDLNGVELNFCRLILGHLLIPLIICSIAVLRSVMPKRHGPQ